jgi:hypothetical protein
MVVVLHVSYEKLVLNIIHEMKNWRDDKWLKQTVKIRLLN